MTAESCSLEPACRTCDPVGGLAVGCPHHEQRGPHQCRNRHSIPCFEPAGTSACRGAVLVGRRRLGQGRGTRHGTHERVSRRRGRTHCCPSLLRRQTSVLKGPRPVARPTIGGASVTVHSWTFECSGCSRCSTTRVARSTCEARSCAAFWPLCCCAPDIPCRRTPSPKPCGATTSRAAW